MTHDQAFALLTSPAYGYGPTWARMLLRYAKIYGRHVDALSPPWEDGTRPATGIYALNDAGTRFSVRRLTITSF